MNLRLGVICPMQSLNESPFKKVAMHYRSILLISLLFFTSATQAQELKSAEEYTQRGISRFEKNDLDGAIADFTKVIEMNGSGQEYCYYFRGMAQYRKGNTTLAIDDLTKAITLKPDPRFLDDRGNLYARVGELDRALTDLNKAIEVSPQYAKAFGDRGLIQLMQGAVADAEADFKKCFELDHTLEPQFKAAASQLKQHTISRFLHEKPSDVEITKFSWAETPAKALVAPSSAPISVSTTGVSATGTRVLGNPGGEKGEGGPSQVLNPSGITTPYPRSESDGTRDFIDYKFNVTIKNTGSKTIVGVKWAYFMEPKNANSEALSYLFSTKTNVTPGKEKTLTDSLNSTGRSASTKVPSKQSRDLYNERVAILRLDYADGTSWESSATPK